MNHRRNQAIDDLTKCLNWEPLVPHDMNGMNASAVKEGVESVIVDLSPSLIEVKPSTKPKRQSNKRSSKQ